MNGNSLRIAVVDDEIDVLMSMQRLLRSRGFAVATYTSGEAFLEALETERPDCLLLDVHMPGLSGSDVQTRLVARRSAVPVVMITGHESASAEAQAMAGGAIGFLRKPADGDAILSMIERAIASRTPSEPDRVP
jgi:FixJ family two-component response regulator